MNNKCNKRGEVVTKSKASHRGFPKIPRRVIISNAVAVVLIQLYKSSIDLPFKPIENNRLDDADDNIVCKMAEQDFRKASRLFTIVTGLEHSGITIVSQLIMSAPHVYGGVECGTLLASETSKLDEVLPFYDSKMRSKSAERHCGISIDQKDNFLNSTCHAEVYDRLHRYSSLYLHPPDEDSWILDKTQLYIRMLVDVMDRSPGVPVVVTEKSFNDQKKSLKKRGEKIKVIKQIIEIKNESLRQAREKYPDRLHVVDMTALYLDPHTVMGQVFDFLGLKWQPKYLTMEAFNSKLPPGSDRGVQLKLPPS